MNILRIKGKELAARGRCVRNEDGSWTVYSLTSPSKYTVRLYVQSDETGAPRHSCTCPYFQTIHGDCKHIRGCLAMVAQDRCDREQEKEPRDRDRDTPPRYYPRPTYRQPDWAAYNLGQTTERDTVQEFLANLCATIPEPPRKPGRGRKPIAIATAIFSAVYKVYIGWSARRGTCDLDECRERGHIDRTPHFNSVLNTLDDPATTPILYELIRLSALPLREVETTFAVDSTGFCTNTYTRFLDVKYGHLKSEQQFVKLHACIGTKTNVICAALILDKRAGDSPQLPHLTQETAKGFTIGECSADAAYAAVSNYDAVAGLGGQLYTAFTVRATGGVGGLFEKAYLTFRLNKEEYLAHYHRRSNIESTYSALKRKIGEAVKSKTETAQRNEVLAKCLAYNLTVLAAEMHQMGIAVNFVATADEPQAILKFPSGA